MLVRSELEFERELDIALATASWAAALRGDLSEGGTAGVKVHAATAGTTPVRVVQGVERFGAELEVNSLAYLNDLEQADVPVLESRLVEDVANVLCIERSRCGGTCLHRRHDSGWLSEYLRPIG